MASKDVPSLGSPWDAVLKAAKDQLPSLDSDSSLSDFEEKEPFIFQRNQPVLIPDLAAELAEDPAAGDKSGSWVPTFKSSPPEQVLVPVGLPTEPSSGQNARMKGPAPQGGRGPGQPSKSCTETSTLLRMAEETPMWLEGDFGSLSLSTKGSHSPAWGPQGEASPSPKGEPKTEPQDEWKDSTKRRALRRERRKMIEKGMLQKVTWDVRDPGCGDQGQAAEPEPKPEVPSARAREGGLVPSLQHLEEWDLDYILKSLSKREDSPGRGKPRSAWWLADSCQGQGQEYNMLCSQDRVQDQRALCAMQSTARTSAQKVSAETSQDTKERETRNRCTVTKCSFQAEPGQRLAAGRSLKTEPPTIFIDLRQTEPLKPLEPRGQSPESSEYSSSDSEEEEEEKAAVGDQQGPAQRAPPSSWAWRDCTGKSQLLQQLRVFRKGVALPELPANKGPGSRKSQAPKDEAGSGTGRKEHVKLWAEGHSAQTRLSGGRPRALEDPLVPGRAREALVPTLGQL